MRAIFQSKFPDLERIKISAEQNSEMITRNKNLYLEFSNIIEKIQNIDGDTYHSIPDIYEIIEALPFAPLSKRMLYERYDGGIVVGAGSGEDCINLIGNPDWKLFDLTDERMTNMAIGYCDSKATFNMTGTRDGDTLTNVVDKYRKDEVEIEIRKLDSLEFSEIGLISMDVEGSALDVLAGATETLLEHEPDLLVSIYHNWIEYLLVVPYLYDLGYDIDCLVTSNMLPFQPHLELSLFCTKAKP